MLIVTALGVLVVGAYTVVAWLQVRAMEDATRKAHLDAYSTLLATGTSTIDQVDAANTNADGPQESP